MLSALLLQIKKTAAAAAAAPTTTTTTKMLVKKAIYLSTFTPNFTVEHVLTNMCQKQ